MSNWTPTLTAARTWVKPVNGPSDRFQEGRLEANIDRAMFLGEFNRIRGTTLKADIGRAMYLG